MPTGLESMLFAHNRISWAYFVCFKDKAVELYAERLYRGEKTIQKAYGEEEQ